MTSSPYRNLLRIVQGHGHRPAIVDAAGGCSYRILVGWAEGCAGRLLRGAADLGGARVGLLTNPDRWYVIGQWGTWMAGGVSVPLSPAHPPAEWEYVLRDAAVSTLLADQAHVAPAAPLADRLGIPIVELDGGGDPGCIRGQAEGEADRPATIVYTSGTTGRPKGVVTTHAALMTQIDMLREAWAWSPEERVLLVLPLHHVHGLVNVLGCAMVTGATCIMHRRFDPAETWEAFRHAGLSVFMAVPTVYQRLIRHWESAPAPERRAMSAGARSLRLMVSGSAALPVQVLERWRAITGHVLLERYGMTEFGMALSNPLMGTRRAGMVGAPLPGVQVRLVDAQGIPVADGEAGELEVRGPTVFRGYWQRPDATRAAFHNGWFRTGDVAVCEDGSYRILGRISTDVLKSGGYKVSALEVESLLRDHRAVEDVVVLGLPDPEWGERIVAIAELRPGAALTLPALREWARPRMAPYKIPTELRIVSTLPRPAMGKVRKGALRQAMLDGREP